MSFIKLGEMQEIQIEKLETCIAEVDPEVLENFKKLASGLKKVAPKAEDFLYFTATIIHAAESSAINEDGTPKLTKSGEPVQVGWDTSNGTYKWITNDPSIQPFKNANCFIAGTKILMEDCSVKNIEDIVPGDKVISHTGKAQTVLHTFKTPYSGKMLNLFIKNNEKITCTPEHPFFHVDFENNKNLKEAGIKALRRKKQSQSPFNIQFKFSKITDLKIGDILTSTILHQKVDSNLNPRRARLLGIFAAQGCYGKKYGKRQYVNFTVGIHEEWQANLIKEIFEEEFPACSVKINKEPERSVIDVTASGHNITEFFYYHVREYSHDKKLSKELVFGSDDVKREFLTGWLDGDSCLTDHNKLIGISVSPHLSYQIRSMLSSLGVASSLRKKDKYKTQFKNADGSTGYKEYDCRETYRIEIYGEGYKKLKLEENSAKYTFDKTVKNRPMANFEKDYQLHRLNKVEEFDFTGDVYNFEVENDHSYIANSIVVHNCDIFPAQELSKAYKKWKHKPLCVDHKSSSVDHVRGFIVDTYYDRKLMRVIALCALDKKGYPQLARQVETGISNNVSMGTGVGRAVCFDCGRVAKAEADFCQHMKYKSGYGEINLDLNPIELSIVVNGADPKATIKNIIASANAMNQYLDNKANELNKLANMTFSATFSVDDNKSTTDAQDQKGFQFSINSDDLAKFKSEIETAFAKLEEFKSSNGENNVEDTNFSAFNQSSGSISMDETAQMDSGIALQTPQNERFASQQDNELKIIIASMEGKLTQMKQSLDKLIKNFTITQEENMSGSNQSNTKVAYFQGAGGVNEPTPGQVKYPKDPLNEHLREKEDRQMVGQSPFPEVGDVEGMHPSPASADPSNELERKKMLARAEAEERAMKRTAIVDLAKKSLENKKAYFQGGGGVNEPTPGKMKYPVDKLNEQDRLHEDKQMVGQSPFPGVGDVEGLHPSPASADIKDELKRKEMLSRASLRARFVKASNQDGSQNRNKSGWEVFLGDKLILTASVDELSGGNTAMMYDTIATKDFGAKLIEKVKTSGAQEVSKLFKKAQATPAPEQAPADLAAPEQASPAVDTGKDGDPKDSAVDLAEKIRDLSSDLVEVVRTLTGEQAEMGNMEQAANDSAKEDPFSAKAMKYSLAGLNDMLLKSAKEVLSELNSHAEELDMIKNMYDTGAVNADNKIEVEAVIQDALNEARAKLNDGFKVITAFVKYARSNQAISKRAEMETQLTALAEGESTMDDMKDDHSAKDGGSDLMNLIHDTNADLDEVKNLMNDEHEDHKHEDDVLGDLDIDGLLNEPEAHLADANDATITGPVDAAKKVDLAPGDTFKATADSKAGRAALRAKLAADALGKEDNGEVQDMSKAKFSDMLDQANRLADGQTELDVKPSDDLGLVETLPEVNKQMMDLAKAPPKVRKDAAVIQRLVSEGKLNAKDVDALVAEGVDKDAVAYWKKYYGEADGGSEFASELVKEHVKAQMEQELNTFKVKLARAYELAYDMVERGLCHREKTAISAQVDEIMKFNDDGFESLKRVVARHSLIQKQAGHMPQVGLLSNDDNFAQSAVVSDEYSQLASMFGNKRGMF